MSHITVKMTLKDAYLTNLRFAMVLVLDFRIYGIILFFDWHLVIHTHERYAHDQLFIIRSFLLDAIFQIIIIKTRQFSNNYQQNLGGGGG